MFLPFSKSGFILRHCKPNSSLDRFDPSLCSQFKHVPVIMLYKIDLEFNKATIILFKFTKLVKWF